MTDSDERVAIALTRHQLGLIIAGFGAWQAAALKDVELCKRMHASAQYYYNLLGTEGRQELADLLSGVAKGL